MTPRRLRFRICAIVLTALALSSLGCMRKQEASQGVLVGAYAIKGSLVENSCGQAALPTKNPLDFTAEIRDVDGVKTWQIAKGPAYTGVLREDGQYRFVSEVATPLGNQVAPKKDLQASDFLSLNADPDLQHNNCTLLMKESTFGTVHRMLTPDGGVQDTDAGVGSDLSGDNTIDIEAASGADCSFQLAANGGNFLTLPCTAHYSLEGTLTEE
jgi:hypothetical protein